MENFIREYENVFSDKFCDDTIELFEWAEGQGFTATRKERENNISKVRKNDTSLFAAEFDMYHATPFLAEGFKEIFWNGVYAPYSEEFEESLLGASEPQHLFAVKAQKMRVGEGYHTWHYEAGDRSIANRLIGFIVYLNDVEEGGETEFLYQHKRAVPKKGSVVMFPGAFTHLHRGNPPISNTKYILTGWLEF